MDSILDLWRDIAPLLHEELGETAFNVWIKTITPVEMTASELILKVPSSMHRDIVAGRFIGSIRKYIKESVGLDVSVKLITEEEAKSLKPRSDMLEPMEEQYEYTFDTYIVGTSNQFAHAAAQSVAVNPGHSYNPLFIYGDSGLGKTHLLFAIRDYVLKKNPGMKVVYIKGDQFTNELIEAISKGQMIEFRKRYRYVDVFLMDDIQFIGGKTSTEEEFFHTFNELHQEHKQIVLTSDRPPREIKTLEDRLRSRFESGILADIQPPEFETRVAIIKRNAAQYGMNIADSTVEYIANRVKSNIRQLEGVVKKMNVICQLEHERPNITTAQTAIRDIITDSQPLPLTIQRIVDEVARSFEVSSADIYSKKRTQPLSLARQVAMYCVREVTGMPYENIGSEFGDRDHTTVIYAVQQVQSKMKNQPDFKATVDDIIKNIKA